VDNRFRDLMQSIHYSCVDHGTEPDGFIKYARNVAGFVKVTDAMLSQGADRPFLVGGSAFFRPTTALIGRFRRYGLAAIDGMVCPFTLDEQRRALDDLTLEPGR